uniref:Transposase-associated domain-containing protein n=1 Tax=Triticum urartu TaxID=4572 RepID=A0A8R7UHZ3_TRIUA
MVRFLSFDIMCVRADCGAGRVGSATMAEDRSWMYTGRQSRKKFTPEWLEKMTEFLERAFRILPPGRPAIVLCPCARCEFRLYRPKDEIQLHLFKNGFAPGYTVWVYHGERHKPQPAKPSDDRPKENGDLDGKKDGAGGGEQASKPQVCF